MASIKPEQCRFLDLPGASQLLDGITEASKQAGNVLFVQVTLALFLLVAAASNEELYLDAEEALGEVRRLEEEQQSAEKMLVEGLDWLRDSNQIKVDEATAALDKRKLEIAQEAKEGLDGVGAPADETKASVESLQRAVDAAKEAVNDVAALLKLARRGAKLEAPVEEIRTHVDSLARVQAALADASKRYNDLLHERHETSLPLVESKVEVVHIFRFGPLLLLCTFFYLQLYIGVLHARMRCLDELADGSPEPMPYPDRARLLYPWLMVFARYEGGAGRIVAPLVMLWTTPVALGALLVLAYKTAEPDAATLLIVASTFLLTFVFCVTRARKYPPLGLEIPWYRPATVVTAAPEVTDAPMATVRTTLHRIRAHESGPRPRRIRRGARPPTRVE